MKRALATMGPGSGKTARLSHAIRVMIVDDSITARTVFTRMVRKEHDLEIVATTPGAEQAITALQSVEVDVILLDLEMPGMGGLEALPLIIAASRGARILVVSSLTVDGAEQTLAALALGAADTLPKPQNGRFNDNYSAMFLGKIRALGCAKTSRTRLEFPQRKPAIATRLMSREAIAALAIGASTGGIHALGLLFRGLPRQLGIPILITQHLPAPLMPSFARQMAAASGLEAVVAEDDMPLLPDRILVAPGHAHLTVHKVGIDLLVRLDSSASPSGCKPSVDPMFTSLADVLGRKALGVVLTGMGCDGVRGAARIVAQGGSIFAQNQESSAVWGMPRAVADAGLAAAILSPEQIARQIALSVGEGARK